MNEEVIKSLHAEFLKDKLPEFTPGDTVKVYVKIVEGTKSRIQPFEGIVIRKKNSGLKQIFTVRKVSFGEGIERTFLTHSPNIDKIKVISRGKVRRAKLYYLRDKSGKEARMSIKDARGAKPSKKTEGEVKKTSKKTTKKTEETTSKKAS